jgi:PAS domain S-box-containing protein
LATQHSVAHVFNRRGRGDAGVVDQAIEPAPSKLAVHGVSSGGDLRALGDVDLYREHSAAALGGQRPSELQLIEDAGQVAIIAIEGERAQVALKKAFREIEESEARLRTIIDVIPQLIVVLSTTGSPLYANRALLEYTGLAEGDAMAPDLHGKISHPEDIARFQELRRQGLAQGVAFETEERTLRHDGQYRWFIVRYNPLRDEQGSVLRWYATGTDINERKQAEERVQNENLALREDIDHASLFEEIVGSSLQPVLAQVEKVAETDSTVLILGETR